MTGLGKFRDSTNIPRAYRFYVSVVGEVNVYIASLYKLLVEIYDVRCILAASGRQMVNFFAVFLSRIFVL